MTSFLNVFYICVSLIFLERIIPIFPILFLPSQLVVLSPDREKRAIRNITTIYLEGGYDDKLFNINLEEMPSSEGLLDYFRMYTEFSTATCQTLLFSSGNKKFHRDHRDHKFDLILFDIGK